MPDFREQLAEIASEINRSEPQQPVLEPVEPENQGEIPEESGEIQEDSGNEEHSAKPLEIKDIAGLVEAIDVDAEWLYGLEVPMPDGEPPIPLGKLKDELQVTRRKARELESQLNQQMALQQGSTPLGNLPPEALAAQGRMQLLQAQFDNTNWDDPDADKGELAYYRQKIIDEYAQTKRAYDAAINSYMGEREKAFASIRQREQAAMLDAIPEWKDSERAKAETQRIREIAMSYGFTSADIDNIIDHRIVVLLRDLANSRNLKEQATMAVKKVRNAPKVLGTSGKKVQKSGNVDQLIQQAQNSNRRTRSANEVAAVKAILGVK